MDFRRSHIQKLLSNNLPGGSSHRKMLPPQRDLTIPADDLGAIKVSGVLLIVILHEDELYTCLIKRPDHMKIHAGQIGLPGGKQEEKDETPKDTAIRETSEEIGIRPEDLEMLGRLSPIYLPVSQFLIHPYVAWCPSMPTFRLNSEEVGKLLLLPLIPCMQNAYTVEKEVETFTGKMKVPGFFYQDEFIWGATAMILTEFFDILGSHPVTRE